MRAAAETDRQGRFSIDSLPPGEYALSVESELHPVFREDKLVVEQKRELDITLEDGLSMEARVVSSRGGKPVPNAEIRVEFSGSNRRMVRTDEKGRFEVRGFVDPEIEEIRISAAGYTRSYYEDIDSSKPQKEFMLEPAAALSGRVVDGSGKPVARARVGLALAVSASSDGEDFDFREAFREMARRSASGTTNVEGLFKITDVTGGELYNVTVDHPDYERLFVEGVEVDRGEEVDDLKLVVSSGARIEVHVWNADGAPLAQASVRLELYTPPAPEAASDGERRREGGRADWNPERMIERMNERERTANRRGSKRSGPGGRAVFAGMEPGLYRVSVEAREHQTSYFEVTAVDDRTVPLAAQLLAERFIAGRVLDLEGNPIRRARVRVTRESRDPLALRSEGGFRGRGDDRDRAEDRSEDDGSYRLGRLSPVPYSLRVSADGYRDLRLEGIKPDRQMDLRLEPLGAIAGQVFALETNMPIERFRVRVERDDEPDDAAESGGDAEDRGSEGRGSEGRGSEGRGSEDRGRGRGDRGRGGRGGRDGGRRGRSFDDPEGRFEMDELEPGRYKVEVSAEGFIGTSVRVEVRSGETTQGLMIALEAGSGVSGIVVKKGTGEPISGASIHLLAQRENVDASSEAGGREDRENSPRRRRDRGDTSRARRRSSLDEAKAAIAALGRGALKSGGQRVESDGTFQLREVPEGRYLLVVEHEEFVPLAREIEVIDGRYEEHELGLEIGERLEGRLKVDRRAGEGYEIVLESNEGLVRRARTDSDGRYSVAGLLPGSYSVRLLSDGATAGGTRTIQIDEGKRNQLNIDEETTDR